jgi:threonylcarbamoyladenosine tRNA methylthiotransferase MtaB
MNFSLVNLGCKVNRVETDSFGAYLLSQGLTNSTLADADIVIVNTCTVTGDAEKKTRKAVRRALRIATKARIIITGCACAINPDFYEGLSSRVTVVAKGSVLSFLEEYISAQNEEHNVKKQRNQAGNSALASTPNVQGYSLKNATPSATTLINQAGIKRVGEAFPTRVSVKIQDGCNHACTYCIVHVARGRAWSRDAHSIISEVTNLASQGVKEIVLTGIDLGSYYFQGMRLSDLLETLLEKIPDVRFRISSIEPCSVDKNLAHLLGQAQGRICKHLHLPLQAGSNKVLAEMNRPYSKEKFKEVCNLLHSEVDWLSLTTDCIVGFPGETYDEFQETCNLAQEIGFSKIHVFRYSKREGTPAALRLDQVSEEEKNKRAQELLRLSGELRISFAQSLLGHTEQVIVEKTGLGMTESYYHMSVPEAYKPGNCYDMCLRSIDTEGVFHE